ncbi:DMT family transporter [candidate division WWE3 bacterium]|nr:DMT family transporter [candidate division WWE3 bacterium]MBT7349337.1 DMT family transporter [candidate division WWE3 bacterium]
MGKIIVLVAAILAGTTGPVLKLGLDSLSPISLMFIRFSIASLIFGTIYLIRNKPRKWEHLKEPFKVSFLSAFALILVILGLSKTTVSNMQAILSIRPLIIAIGAYHLLGERVSKAKKIGLVSGLLGLLIIVFQPAVYGENGLSVGSLEGNLLMLGSAFVSALYTIKSKRVSDTHLAQTMTFTTFIVTSVLFGLIALGRHYFLDISLLEGFNAQSAWVLAYLVLFSTLLMFYMYILGLKKTSATFVGISQYVQFLVTVILGIIFFRDSVTPMFIVGSGLILFAAYLGGNSD